MAGELGTWSVRLTDFDADLPAGAALRIQLPRSWHTTRLNQAKGVHSVDPAKANYVGLKCSSRTAHLGWYVEHGTSSAYTGVNSRLGLDGRAHRYNYVVRVLILEGVLDRSDTVEIIFGDRSAGSPGFEAGFQAGDFEPVSIAIDYTGDGAFAALPTADLPMLAITAGPLAEVALVAPSQANVGEAVAVRAIGLDLYQNAAALVGALALKVVEGVADVVEQPPAEDQPFQRVWQVKPTASGTLRFETRCGRLSARSNPMLAELRQAATSRIFWGDLHSHSEASYDGVGGQPYDYARNVSCLDFYALTEHTESWGQDGEQRWEILRAEANAHDAPGHFATLHAYEATLDAPYAHHNVFFREDPSITWPLINRENGGTLQRLWDSLSEGDALTVPHHTGIAWPARSDLDGKRSAPIIDWSIREDRFRKLVEMYSSHGQSELYDPEHPLAYERMVDWSLSSYSVPGPHYAQDGWLTGQHMGAVSGSDNHFGQPGKSHTGLTAAIAPELNRASIYDALDRRQVYATTGARIILQFSVDGIPMGGNTAVAGEHRVEIFVVGTDDIETVTLLRGDSSRQQVDVAIEWAPAADQFRIEWQDREAPPAGFYYVRVLQRRPVRGRAVLAWSSPVWFAND